MNKKAVVSIIVVALLLGLASVGFAASESGSRFKERCQEIWAGLTPEEQEQVEEAREDFKRDMKALREEFQERRGQLREEFLEKLPEQVREQMAERHAAMQERMEKRFEQRGSKGPGFRQQGCPFNE